MKRRRRKIEITEEQQMILGILLVILLAISLLYCLGFASLVLRQAWEDGPLPWEGESLNREGNIPAEEGIPSIEGDLVLPEEQIDTTPLPSPVEPTSPATAPP
jgi:hypothetical protein